MRHFGSESSWRNNQAALGNSLVNKYFINQSRSMCTSNNQSRSAPGQREERETEEKGRERERGEGGGREGGRRGREGGREEEGIDYSYSFNSLKS